MDFLKSSISPIGFGAFKIGRNEGTKYPSSYDLPDDAGTERLLNGVLDLGVTYIDTAPAYGLSEERIGRFLSHRKREFVLSTKVGERFDKGVSTYDFSAIGIRESIERSLLRLRCDVIDLVFLHAPRNDLEVLARSDAVSTLLASREAGLVRAIGFSGYTPDAFRQALSWADALMIEYHRDNKVAEPVIAEAAARGSCVIVKKGLHSGHAAGAGSIEFVLNNPGVTSLVVGSLSLPHMEQNVRTARTMRSWTGPLNPSAAQGG